MAVPTKTLFFLRLFTSFPFAIFYSSMVLVVTAKFHLSPLNATQTVGCFLGLNYALAVIGGYLAGKFVSYRMLFLLSILFQFMGSAFFLAPNLNLAIGFAAIFLAGSLGSTVSINLLLTQYFTPNDINRERAFFWNYSAMNIGYFLGYLCGGWLLYNTQNGEGIMFITSSMLAISVLMLLIQFTVLKDKSTPYINLQKNNCRTHLLLTIFCLIFVSLVSFISLKYAYLINDIILLIWVICIAFIVSMAIRHKHLTKSFLLFLVYYGCGVFFWSIYLLAPLALILFLKHAVLLNVAGISIAPQWIQNINTFVVVFGTISTTTLLKKPYFQKHFSLPVFFAFSLVFMGLGFLMLYLGCCYLTHGKVAIEWVILSYVLQSLGEISIGPIGYALVGRIIPQKYHGIFSGFWILIIGVAAIIASKISQYLVPKDIYHHYIASFQNGFLTIIIVCLLIAIPLIICGKQLAKMS